MLIDAGCDIDAKSKNGMTAAMYASGNGQIKQLAQLIAAGCDTKAKDGSGRTATQHAEKHHRTLCCGMLEAEEQRKSLADSIPDKAKNKKAIRM